MANKPKYDYGELVRVFYSENALFEVVGRTKTDSGEFCYILEDVDDGTYMEALEYELSSPYDKFRDLWSNGMTAEEMNEVREWNASFGLDADGTPAKKSPKVSDREILMGQTFDELLDQLNIYKELATMFPDDPYFTGAQEVILDALHNLSEVK